ncbi:hypothetical protein HF086_016934 [Spodoptera exigua]|uniref:Uncharacterized protein n=1 Tax=Spodoptera exigua TaxID=7107 RepID=A0A922MGI0_SPOEX|nr:hypothetical protein HF086_016934 [Spodoptera exigua]
MVFDFQKDNSMAATQRPADLSQQQLQPAHQPAHHAANQPPHQQHKSQQVLKNPDILSTMQNVLCKNFPTIPCGMIVEDETLRNLIERSIQQLKYKKLSMEQTTAVPGYHLTLFPSINSEDLSNFLQVSGHGYFNKNKSEQSRAKIHRKRVAKDNAEQPTDKDAKKKSKSTLDNTRSTLYNGRKKIRKFYPHKIKYKDKTKARKEFVDYSEEKLSMSVEVPDLNGGGVGVDTGRKQSHNVNYKVEPADPPVWRIDYMKHGEPSLNVFGYEPDRLKEKLVKTGRNVFVSENVLEQAARKDVLHPDVYIKKNYIRKNALDMNSGSID